MPNPNPMHEITIGSASVSTVQTWCAPATVMLVGGQPSRKTWILRNHNLHFQEGHVSTLKLLKSYGALLDSSDSKGRNPLHMAAISQRIECVQYLLSEGVHDIPDAQGVRPSQLAKKPEVKQAFENLVDTT